MDMNYLIQRRINARKRFRRKVIFTITLGVILLILIIVGLIKIITDERKGESEGITNLQGSVMQNQETTENPAESGAAVQSGADDTMVTPVATPVATPTPTPIPRKKIAIDAGHGGDDWGSTREELYEKDANLAISFFLKEKLEAAGYDVFMTRDADVWLDKEDRPVLAEESGADLFVSIHLNSLEGDSDTTRGFEVWYDGRRGDGSNTLAQDIADEMDKVLDARNRGIKESRNLVVLNRSIMPAVLVECGFITSETERAMLFDPEYQEKLAEGIFNGIQKFLPVE